MGDIRALVAGGDLAAAGYAELVEKYGTEDLMAIIEELMSYSERLDAPRESKRSQTALIRAACAVAGGRCAAEKPTLSR